MTWGNQIKMERKMLIIAEYSKNEASMLGKTMVS